MSFAEPPGARLIASKVRIAFGAIAACAAPAFLLAFLPMAFPPVDLSPGPELWLVLSLLLSPFVAFFFLPVILLQLPKTERPLLACLIAGGCSVSAPLTLLALILLPAAGAAGIARTVLLAAAFVLPVGLASGLAFWLCVVWRNPSFRERT